MLRVKLYGTNDRFLLVSTGLVEDNAHKHIVGIDSTVGALGADIIDACR